MLFDPDKPNLYEKVNALRTSPDNFTHKFDIVAKALSRTKKNSQEAKELVEIKNFIIKNKGISLSPFELSYGLCKTAEAIIRTIIQTGNEFYTVGKELLEKTCLSYLDEQKGLFYICDFGDLDNFVIRMLISSHDSERTYKKAVFSKSLKYIGFASREYLDEELNIVLLAEEVKEKHFNNDESDLKEIFDILDQDGNELLEPSSIKEAMLALQFNIKNYKFVEMFEKMESMVKNQNLDGIDFETFKSLVETYYVVTPYSERTKKDWKKIFELFVDDFQSMSISIQNIKRIALHLEEQLEPHELKKFMKWVSQNGSELSFDEFYNIMKI